MTHSSGKNHEEARVEFERSMNELERSLAALEEEASLRPPDSHSQPNPHSDRPQLPKIPPKTTQKTSQKTSPASSQKNSFDLAALEEAAADIEAFMRDRTRDRES